MINHARETNVYKIWADMVAFDRTDEQVGGYHYCGFAGLRDYKNYVLSHDEIIEKYGKQIKMDSRLPDALSDAMGNKIYMAIFDTKEELDAYFKDLLETK